MKWYWHLLFLILATVAAWFTGDWLNQPLWQIEEARPVSFDKFDAARKEWTTLTGDADRKNWWIETRAGRDPTVIRRLKLELPPLKGEYPYFGASISIGKLSCDALLCHEYIRSGGVEMHYCILDPATGKLLRRFTIPINPFGSITGYRNKLAFVEGGSVYLYDISTKSERSVRIGNPTCLTFSPDGKLLACVNRVKNTFMFIDWEKGELSEPIQPKTSVTSFCFITDDTLLVSHDRDSRESFEMHSRWHWDGTALKQISPGIKLDDRQIMPMVKPHSDGELHLSVNQVKDWPLQLKPLFQWLADKKYSIERWIPKQFYRHWVVLDDQDHIQREYYASEQYKRHALYDQLSVEVEPDKQYAISTITFWNEHPVWPNAMAVGVMLYLLLYIMMRVRQSWSSR